MRLKILIGILLISCVAVYANANMMIAGGGVAASDVTAPEFSSASIAADGETVTINFSENVTGTENDTFNLDCDGTSGADVSLTYSSGSGGTALVFTAGETILSTETCNLDFDGDADDFEDDAGNDLADFSDETVTNNSEEIGSGTDYTADANCMGAWFMNSATDATETDRSGEGVTLSETGSDSIVRSSTVPVGFSGYSKDFESGDTEALWVADGSSADISGNALTICLWAKFEDDVSADETFINNYNGGTNARQFLFKFDDADDCVEVLLSSDGTASQKTQGNTSRSSLGANWHHHCVVYNGTDIRIYLDGILDTNTSTDVCTGGDNPCAYSDGIASGKTNQFVVGAYENNSSAWFDGLLDEVIIFNRALSAGEVLEIKTYGIDGTKGAND